MTAALLLRWLGRSRVPWPLAAATVLVLEEMARTAYLGGMPWPARSLAFAAWPVLVASSAYFGAYALTFVATFVAAAIAGRPGERHRHARSWLVPLSVGGALVVGLVGLGTARDPDGAGGLPTTGRGVMLAVQANIPQSMKHAHGPDAANTILTAHLDLSADALASARAHGEVPIAVLWPETMVLFDFLDADLAARFPDHWQNMVRVAQNIASVEVEDPPPFLIGAIYDFRRGDERHTTLWQYGSSDSIFWLDPAAAPPADRPPPPPPPVGAVPDWVRGRHDKTILVPWGEYAPLKETLPWLAEVRQLVAEIPELVPGAVDQEPFALAVPSSAGGDVAFLHAGTANCFELLFPQRCRHWRRRGATVLLNAANYGWFGRTTFRAQIRAAAALRAAETATTVVVAGNTGPTLLFGPRGRPCGRFERAGEGPAEPPEADSNTFCAGFAAGAVVVDPEPTPYVRWGDFPWLGLGLLVLLGGLRRRPSHDDGPVTDGAYHGPRVEAEGENL